MSRHDAELRAAIAGLNDHQRERLGRGWRKTIEKKERTDGKNMRMSRLGAEELRWSRFLNTINDFAAALKDVLAIPGLNDQQREVFKEDFRKRMKSMKRTIEKKMRNQTGGPSQISLP